MTILQAQQLCISSIRPLYGERESGNIADWVMEHVTGKKRIDRLMNKQLALTPSQVEKLHTLVSALATHQPVQYVLQEAWFAGMKFFVNPHVLIPRPETEELVEWINETLAGKTVATSLIDIGTGSGCIPVTLKKKWPQLSVTAVDISEGALAVARSNATNIGADVRFEQMDFLKEDCWSKLEAFDIIVSNPPYIKQSEAATMSENVLGFEPPVALFVPDNDALVFYRKLARFGKQHLTKDGHLFVEINESLGQETKTLFESEGYTAELRKDLQGKDRMVMAKRDESVL